MVEPNVQHTTPTPSVTPVPLPLEVASPTPPRDAVTVDVGDHAGDAEFRLTRDGRRQAFILLIGVLSLLVFAVWSLVTILDGGLSGAEYVSAILMLAIIVVAPLVAWTLLEEANARVSITSRGLRYQTLGGIDLLYPWQQLDGFKPRGGRGRIARLFLGDEDDTSSEADKLITTAGDSANDENREESEKDEETLSLMLKDSYRAELRKQLPNPVVRFLHMQAGGANVPVYGNLENRAELVSQIESRIRNNE